MKTILVVLTVLLAGEVWAGESGMCKVFKEQGQLKSNCPYFHPITEPDWTMKMPKSLDGGTIELGSGRRWKIVETDGNELVNCTSDSLSSCRVVGLDKKLECHQRMQEVMKAMDKIHDDAMMNTKLNPIRSEDWYKTMSECVTGK